MIHDRYKPGYRYGKWAGCPQGQAEDPTCCVTEVFPPGRAPMHQQCHRKRGYGPNGLYCAQHNPEKIAAKAAAKDQVDKDRRQREDNIEKRGKALIKELGCGELYYHNASRFKDCGYREMLLISFDDIRVILRELNRK